MFFWNIWLFLQKTLSLSASGIWLNSFSTKLYFKYQPFSCLISATLCPLMLIFTEICPMYRLCVSYVHLFVHNKTNFNYFFPQYMIWFSDIDQPPCLAFLSCFHTSCTVKLSSKHMISFISLLIARKYIGFVLYTVQHKGLPHLASAFPISWINTS